jgi:O-antigen ligase
MVVYLAISFVTSLFGMNFLQSLYGNLFLANGIIELICLMGLAFLTFYFTVTHKNYYEILTVLSTSFFCVCLIGITHYVLFLLGIVSGDLLYDARTVSTLGQPNMLAGYILICLPVLFYLRSKKDVVSSKLLNIKIGAALICLLLTFSRTGVLCALLEILIYYLFFSTNKVLARIAQALTALGAVAIFTMLVINKAAPITTMFKGISDSPSYYQAERFLATFVPSELSGEKRVDLYKYSFEAIGKSVFTGYGKGNINTALYTVIEPGTPLTAYYISDAHNLVLNILIESGIIGLISFLIVMYALVKYLISVRTPESRMLTFSLLALVINGMLGIASVTWYFVVAVLGGWFVARGSLEP